MFGDSDEGSTRGRNGYLYPAGCRDDAMIVNVAGSTGVQHSDDSLVSKLSSKIDAPIISSGVRTMVNISDSAEFSAQELDKNTENLANAYMCSRLRSSCSLINQTSRSYGSLNPYMSKRTTSFYLFDLVGMIQHGKCSCSAINTVLPVHLIPVQLLALNIHDNKKRAYSENISATETTSRDSPLSIMSSQSNRRSNGVVFVPICPPPSYQPPKGQTVQQIISSPLLPTTVQVAVLNRIFKLHIS
ncbi:unnamed protein product [Brugia timori]|uniref:Uncharacterized protein n=1 Tax=Brugia timori TaxID=42155 RepID=A0A0R3Q9W0_9BILA|nr:unnamed protein product [Brugia timori]